MYNFNTQETATEFVSVLISVPRVKLRLDQQYVKTAVRRILG